MKVKSYFVLLKLEPFIGKMRQMWQSTNAFAVVQMTCGDILLLAYYKVKIAAKMMLKRIEYCCYDIGSATDLFRFRSLVVLFNTGMFAL